MEIINVIWGLVIIVALFMTFMLVITMCILIEGDRENERVFKEMVADVKVCKNSEKVVK